MSVQVTFKDGSPDITFGNGIDAGPYVNGELVDNSFIQIVDSSHRVALVPTALVRCVVIS
jgi:hypothetical protein